MELKNRKYINNKKRYPKYWIGTVAALIGRNLQGALELANQHTASSNEIMAGQLTTQGNIGGISYDKMDENINEDQYLSQYSNPAIASDLSSLNFVGAFGKMFGGGKRRQLDLIRLALQKIRNINDAKKSDALQQLTFNEDVEKQKKAHDFYEYAYEGRAPRNNNRRGSKTIVDTAYGKMPGKQNAWVNKGERIVDTITGMEHQVKRGPGDTAPAYLTGKDAVLSASKRRDLVNPETGNSFAEDYPSYKAAGLLGRLLALNSMVHQNIENTEHAYKGRDAKYPRHGEGDSPDDLSKYNGENGTFNWGAFMNDAPKFTPNINLNPSQYQSAPMSPNQFNINDFWNTGKLPYTKNLFEYKLPSFDKKESKDNNFRDKDLLLSPWMSIVPAGLQAASTISAAINLHNQPTSNINSYRENPYGRYALDKLSKLRVNAQPALHSLDRAYAAQANDIDRNLSLTAGQKLAHKLAANNAIQSQRAKILADTQNMNNQYDANWANSMMNYGWHDTGNKINTYQYDTRYNDQARANKHTIGNTYMEKLNNNLGNLASNLIKTYLANKTYNRYAV